MFDGSPTRGWVTTGCRGNEMLASGFIRAPDQVVCASLALPGSEVEDDEQAVPGPALLAITNRPPIRFGIEEPTCPRG